MIEKLTSHYINLVLVSPDTLVLLVVGGGGGRMSLPNYQKKHLLKTLAVNKHLYNTTTNKIPLLL